MNRLSREDLLSEALKIARGYGGNLTLRQLYYRCVALGHSPNDDKDYNRLKDVISEARMNGSFPFSWLMDRSRTVHAGSFRHRWADVEDALQSAADDVARAPNYHLQADRWWGQSRHVSVWIEKEALSGVFEGPCNSLGVSWFACKGYPSLSSLWLWTKTVSEAYTSADADPEWEGGIEEAVILYFGDHDPDGFQIHKTALLRVHQIATVEGFEMPPIRLERVALNRDQIERFQPPPFPAKKSSPRFRQYAIDHPWTKAGPDYFRSWELDALEPAKLAGLCRSTVGALFDSERRAEVMHVIEARRDEMRARMKRPEWMEEALSNIPDVDTGEE